MSIINYPGSNISQILRIEFVGAKIRDLSPTRLILIVEIPFKSGSIDLSKTVRSAFERNFYDKYKSIWWQISNLDPDTNHPKKCTNIQTRASYFSCEDETGVLCKP